MDRQTITAALEDIATEQDATLKAMKLASLCSAVFRERGIELVVVGGSAIEFLTEGAYTSGDIDFCLVSPASIPLRQRQEIMGELGAAGGPRSWEVAGLFVDLLGSYESAARTGVRKIRGPFGEISLAQPEELLVERILVSVYPQPYPAARDAARKLASVALGGGMEMNWQEVRRIANLPEYRILSECEKLIGEVANEVSVKNPFDSD